jgi:CRP-like cAMP-binding protein
MPSIDGGEAAMMVEARIPLNAPAPPPTRNHNRLLAALPPDDYNRIAPTLQLIPLKLKRVLHKPGEPIRDVYFPGGGFCSMLTVLDDGRMVEVATIGREGMVGTSAILDGGPVSAMAMVLAEMKTCYRMAVADFRSEMDRRGALFHLLGRYSQALAGFIMQSTACNAVHSVEQRLARWLLLASDRVGSHDFPLTQEFAAMMLGAARPTVSVVAGTLQKAGLITYHRGQVTILNRKKLEGASCECYRAATALLQAVTDR